MKNFLREIPAWAWGIIGVYALIEPLSHVWLLYFPPAGTVHTGMHIPDSAVFSHGMRIFENDFYSPYVPFDSADGGHSFKYFPVPFMWMYAVVGSMGRVLGLPEFLTLGLANGLGAAVFLVSMYAFFRTVAREHAGTAFLLFTVGGGLAGLGYLVCGVMGWIDHPEFTKRFFNIAQYELVEGSRMKPWLIVPRLYYTLPLALGHLAFVALVRGLEERRPRIVALSCLLLFLGSLINIRLGPFMGAVALLYLCCAVETPIVERLKTGAGIITALLAALVIAVWMLSWNPTYADNAFTMIRRSLWLSSFVYAEFFHLILLGIGLRFELNRLPKVWATLARILLGYMAAFVVLYLGYQVYFGSYLPPIDYSAAVRISDFALVGVLVGGVWAWRAQGADNATDPASPIQTWLVLWVLIFIAIAPSAFAQGLFLKLSPQRMVLLLGGPLCVLSAATLHRLYETRPRLSQGLKAAMVGCGVLSIATSVLYFQGPLGFTPGQAAFSQYHSEVMSETDARLLDRIGEGVVMVSSSEPSFGDIVALRGNQSLYGAGALDMSPIPGPELGRITDAFFDSETPEEERRELAERFGVEWILSPHSWPMDAETIEQFQTDDWLEEVAGEGDGAVFRVRRVREDF